jgi:hypothetical protein
MRWTNVPSEHHCKLAAEVLVSTQLALPTVLLADEADSFGSKESSPDMMAGVAPKAFGVEKTVEPNHWLIHYKGRVSPPENGRYRFAR